MHVHVLYDPIQIFGMLLNLLDSLKTVATGKYNSFIDLCLTSSLHSGIQSSVSSLGVCLATATNNSVFSPLPLTDSPTSPHGQFLWTFSSSLFWPLLANTRYRRLTLNSASGNILPIWSVCGYFAAGLRQHSYSWLHSPWDPWLPRYVPVTKLVFPFDERVSVSLCRLCFCTAISSWRDQRSHVIQDTVGAVSSVTRCMEISCQ
jgi:hypothetical protein